MRLAGLALSAAVALALAGPWLRDMGRTGLTRENYRGRSIAFPAGAVLLACSLVALAPLALLDDRADLDLLDPELRRWAVYVFGVALLGLLDDGLGRGALEGAPRGWRGHAAAVLAGRFSTGAIKGIGALALAACRSLGLLCRRPALFGRSLTILGGCLAVAARGGLAGSGRSLGGRVAGG